MVQFVCDTCGALKQPDEEWILGFAAENIGLNAARREVTIAPAWDDQRACAWLAVHFCSEQCKDEYVVRLFGSGVGTADMEKRPHRVVRAAKRKRA